MAKLSADDGKKTLSAYTLGRHLMIIQLNKPNFLPTNILNHKPSSFWLHHSSIRLHLKNINS